MPDAQRSPTWVNMDASMSLFSATSLSAGSATTLSLPSLSSFCRVICLGWKTLCSSAPSSPGWTSRGRSVLPGGYVCVLRAMQKSPIFLISTTHCGGHSASSRHVGDGPAPIPCSGCRRDTHASLNHKGLRGSTGCAASAAAATTDIDRTASLCCDLPHSNKRKRPREDEKTGSESGVTG
jgi:hypothetical protein